MSDTKLSTNILEALIKRFNQGDEKAFKTLYKEFFKPACVFASRYVKSDADVIDIIQETFLNIWEKREVFISVGFFKAYLYKAVRNNCFKYIRDKQVENKYINQQNISEEGESFLRAIVVEEVHREIINVLNKLPEERRKIMMLVLAGLNNNQIAEDLKISVNTIKTQKKRAYSYLREELKDTFLILLVLFSDI